MADIVGFDPAHFRMSAADLVLIHATGALAIGLGSTWDEREPLLLTLAEVLPQVSVHNTFIDQLAFAADKLIAGGLARDARLFDVSCSPGRRAMVNFHRWRWGPAYEAWRAGETARDHPAKKAGAAT